MVILDWPWCVELQVKGISLLDDQVTHACQTHTTSVLSFTIDSVGYSHLDIFVHVTVWPLTYRLHVRGDRGSHRKSHDEKIYIKKSLFELEVHK